MRFRLLFTLFLFAGPAALRCAAEDRTFRIGFIGAFSGPAQAYGVASKNGFEMARADFPGSRLEVVYEDDGFVPAKAVTAFRKLTDVDRIDAVITIGSSPSKAVAPLAQSKGIPLFAWASDPEVSAGHPVVLRTWVSGEREGARMADEIARRKYRKISFIVAPLDYARSVQRGVEASVPGGVLAQNEEYPADAQDFKPFLMKARRLGAEAIGMCLNPGQLALLARQSLQMGYSPQFFGCEVLHDHEEVKASQGALVGSWLVTSSVTPEFQARYVKQFGNESVISGAAMHYDLYRILTELAAKGAGREEVLPRILALGKQHGAIGEVVPVSGAADRFLDIPLVIKEATPESFKLLG